MGVKHMVTVPNKMNEEEFSNHRSCQSTGIVSSVNANTNVEGTIVIKNVPLEFIQQLTVGSKVVIQYDKN